jgi:hypothetical protein
LYNFFPFANKFLEFSIVFNVYFETLNPAMLKDDEQMIATKGD